MQMADSIIVFMILINQDSILNYNLNVSFGVLF